ncbi:hypothetical protein NC651_031047 [Populus alba x Populus x berolinensis]|nr:hypothetical protein NC651_031047 [Populus alba x Populus x berolinensis]
MDCNGDGFLDLDEFINAVKDDGNFGKSNKAEYLMDVFLIFLIPTRIGLISARDLPGQFLQASDAKNAALQIAQAYDKRGR